MTRAARGAALGRLLAAVVLVLLAVLVVTRTASEWSGLVRIPVGARTDLLLDVEHVELADGFGPYSTLTAFNDYELANPDRDEVCVLFPRRGRLLWEVEGGGHLRTGITRLVHGGAADDSPTRLSVTVRHEGGEHRSSALVPPAPALPGAGPGLHEGPASSLVVALPPGRLTLELATESPDPVPDGSLVGLLSPRIERDPTLVRLRDWPMEHVETTDLIARAARSDERVRLGTRRLVSREGADGPRAVEDAPAAPLEVPSVEPVGAFEGRPKARPAVALTGPSRLALTLDLPDGAALVGSLARDARLPDAEGALRVLVDGVTVHERRVGSATWAPLRVPLGEHAGPGRRLVVELEPDPFAPRPVVHAEPDLAAGVMVGAEYRLRALRVGLGELRIERPVRVARRLVSDERPTVILVQVETLRADVLAPYGGREDVTPRLAALADRLVVFERAMAPSPWTLPSTASVLTGVLPVAHGVDEYSRPLLPGALPTLAERARADGVTTSAFVANDLLQAPAGYARGVSDWAMLPYANARQVLGLAIPWFQRHASVQSLMFLHLFDPHGPYNAPGEDRVRFVEEELRALDPSGLVSSVHQDQLRGVAIPPDDPRVRALHQRYLGEVRYLDRQLGELVDAIDASGQAERTVLLVTADHGEEFMEHGLYGHSYHPYDETLHVPLFAYAPGGQLGEPRRVPGVVSTAGVHALVLDLLGVPYDEDAVEPAPTRGRDLRFAYSETRKGIVPAELGGDRLRRTIVSVRTDTHRLVRRLPVEGEPPVAETELYDLTRDPDAQRPLDPDDPAAAAVRERLAGLLEQSVRRQQERRAAAPGQGNDAALLGRLRALGYVGGDEPPGEPRDG